MRAQRYFHRTVRLAPAFHRSWGTRPSAHYLRHEHRYLPNLDTTCHTYNHAAHTHTFPQTHSYTLAYAHPYTDTYTHAFSYPFYPLLLLLIHQHQLPPPPRHRLLLPRSRRPHLLSSPLQPPLPPVRARYCQAQHPSQLLRRLRAYLQRRPGPSAAVCPLRPRPRA